jgi:hypothetical protein
MIMIGHQAVSNDLSSNKQVLLNFRKEEMIILFLNKQKVVCDRSVVDMIEVTFD